MLVKVCPPCHCCSLGRLRCLLRPTEAFWELEVSSGDLGTGSLSSSLPQKPFSWTWTHRVPQSGAGRMASLRRGWCRTRPDWAPFHSGELKLGPLSFSLPGRLHLVFTGGNAALYSAGLGLLLRFLELHTFKDTYKDRELWGKQGNDWRKIEDCGCFSWAGRECAYEGPITCSRRHWRPVS